MKRLGKRTTDALQDLLPAEPRSRRELLAGALGVIAAEVIGQAAPARAGTDGDVVLGAPNNETTTTSITNTASGDGFDATGGGNGNGVSGTGGGSGAGLFGTGGSNGIGVVGVGQGNGGGVQGTGSGSGVGVAGQGGATDGVGVAGLGQGNGIGVEGTGSGSGAGLFGTGGSSDGAGVQGNGIGNGPGVSGLGSGNGAGVVAQAARGSPPACSPLEATRAERASTRPVAQQESESWGKGPGPSLGSRASRSAATDLAWSGKGTGRAPE